MQGEAHAEEKDQQRADSMNSPKTGAWEFESGIVEPVLMILSHGLSASFGNSIARAGPIFQWEKLAADSQAVEKGLCAPYQ